MLALASNCCWPRFLKGSLKGKSFTSACGMLSHHFVWMPG